MAEACQYNLVDSTVAMNGAFLVNAAILDRGRGDVLRRGIRSTEIQDAHAMLDSLLGSWLAPYAFALALLCAGQSSTITGTLAGQITMEGFLRFRIRPWLRRLVTRTLAIVPAVAVILGHGRRQGSVYQLLILSQVVLSLQLSFAVVPLVRFTGSQRKMGPFVSRWWLQTLAWVVTVVIMALNAKLVYKQVSEWIVAAGAWGWLVGLLCVPVSLALVALLLWMVFAGRSRAGRARGLGRRGGRPGRPAQRRFRRIGVALDARSSDAAMLAEAVCPGQNPSGRTGVDATSSTAWAALGTAPRPATWKAATTKPISTRWPNVCARRLQGQGVPAVEPCWATATRHGNRQHQPGETSI